MKWLTPDAVWKSGSVWINIRYLQTIVLIWPAFLFETDVLSGAGRREGARVVRAGGRKQLSGF